MTDVAGFSGVSMEPGTLYGALSRLERRGWVRPLPTEERRRPYEITAAGEAVLAEQLATMQQVVRTGRGAPRRPEDGDDARPGRPPIPALVACYPRRWRQRYAPELLAVLDQHQPSARTVLNLAAGAASTTWTRPGARIGPACRSCAPRS